MARARKGRIGSGAGEGRRARGGVESGWGGSVCIHFLWFVSSGGCRPGEGLLFLPLKPPAGLTLIPFPYSNPLLSQLSPPSPSLILFQFSPPPSARLPPSPRLRHCGFLLLRCPAPSPPRGHRADSLHSPSFVLSPQFHPSSSPPLRAGFGDFWVERRPTVYPWCPSSLFSSAPAPDTRPPAGESPGAPSPKDVAVRRGPCPAVASHSRPCLESRPLPKLCALFPGRPRTVARSLVLGGLAWALDGSPRAPGPAGSSSHLDWGLPLPQPPPDAPPPPVAAPSSEPAVFTGDGGEGERGAGGSANQRRRWGEKGWQGGVGGWGRKRRRSRTGVRVAGCGGRGPSSCGRGSVWGSPKNISLLSEPRNGGSPFNALTLFF